MGASCSAIGLRSSATDKAARIRLLQQLSGAQTAIVVIAHRETMSARIVNKQEVTLQLPLGASAFFCKLIVISQSPPTYRVAGASAHNRRCDDR